MIKIFRKIRQKMLTENQTAGTGRAGKFNKYLLYAVGEIALVMIGILLALQVNNWNEERKNRKIELEVLIELNEEFISNKNRFDIFSSSMIKLEATWFEFLNDASDILDKDKISVRRPSNGASSFNISNSILRSFLNTGKIENISNDSLKYLLVDWETEMITFKDIQGRHVNFVESELRKFEFSRRIIPNLNAGKKLLENPFFKLYSEKEVKTTFVNFNSDLEYQNILMINYMWINVRIEKNLNLENKFDEIIKLLNDEIGKR